MILWEYQVKPERLAEFESIYAANGAWAELFQKGEGYLGAELYRDPIQPGRFVTIDRWRSAEAYADFKTKWKTEYQTLDARCNDLTEHETLIGTFLLVPSG